MADGIGDEPTLDAMFEWLEQSPLPQGYRTEIVGGHVFVSPQRDTPLEITADIHEQLGATYSRKGLKSDVRIDYPGYLNGFATDVTLLAEDAAKDDKGLWRYQDVEFVAEVISKKTAANDYGPKKSAYADAEVPVYLIADPYQGRCFLCTHPKNGEYATETKLSFGDTVVGLTLKTDEFPRDQTPRSGT
ncbi:Uma2 family endonuclease [Streptomyces sp. QTS52]